MKQEINVAIAFDRNYWNPFCALITSICENKNDEQITFHFIAPDINGKERDSIKNLCEQHDSIVNFYEINKLSVDKYVLTSHYTVAVYYRLFFPLLLKNKCERLIYLDTDVVVINSLSKLYNVDLQGFPVGAVYDNYVKKRPELDIHKEGEYFNSGVLLIDIDKWNRDNISEKTMQYLLENESKILYVDQCALNAVLKNRWYKLEAKYNLMYSYLPWDIPFYNRKKILKDVSVIHYTLERPWKYLSRTPLRYLYFKYLKLSSLPVKDPIVSDKNLALIHKWLKIRIYEFYSLLKNVNTLFNFHVKRD